MLHTSALGPGTSFLVFTDAAFKTEEDVGHALKGTLAVRVATNKGDPKHVMKPLELHKCHVIDKITKRVRNVTRSTSSAELFSLCAMHVIMPYFSGK